MAAGSLRRTTVEEGKGGGHCRKYSLGLLAQEGLVWEGGREWLLL